MKRIVPIMFLIILFTANASAASNIFMVDLRVYPNKTVEIINFHVEEGVPTVLSNSDTGYEIELFSNEELLFSGNLPVSFEGYGNDNWLGPRKIIALEYVDLYLRLPYYPSASKIEIYYEATPIFTFEFKERLCNYNNKCEEFENYLSCPNDCNLENRDEFCVKDKDGICDPDCFEGVDPDCKDQTKVNATSGVVSQSPNNERKSINTSWLIMGGGLLLGVVLLFFAIVLILILKKAKSKPKK